jgi:hypothetical protein
MAKRSKQTFRKRQRELAKKRKKEAKAERLAARRSGRSDEEDTEGKPEDDQDEGGLKILKVRLTGSKRDE